jgi:predicted DsbA family dithiol-disulfide isomerase
MPIKVTYYLEVTSSWCYWAEPAWAELQDQYDADSVQFQWRIALLDTAALPASCEQADWFYRRSGTLVGSPFMLSSHWREPDLKEYLAPNCVAEAAKDFGVTDDRVRLALAEAALRDGKRVGQWDIAATVAATAAGLTVEPLLTLARSDAIEHRVRQSTADFHALQVNQRPTFLLESDIGDRAVLSGFWRIEPIAAALDSMLADAAAYRSWNAHVGEPPAS